MNFQFIQKQSIYKYKLIQILEAHTELQKQQILFSFAVLSMR